MHTPDVPTAAGSRASRATRRRVLSGLGLSGVAALAGCVVGDSDRRTGSVEFTVPGGSVDRLQVSADDAAADVRGWDGRDVRVEATKYARGGTDLSDVRVRRDLIGRQLSIGVEVDGLFPFGGGGLETLSVAVPRDVQVEQVDLDDGTARLTDLRGALSLSVDDGDAHVDALDGSLDVEVDDGQVTANGVDRVAGTVDDGRLEMVDGAELGDCAADDGDLVLAIDDLDGDVRIESDDGDVLAALSPVLDATFEVQTDDGAVDIEADVFDHFESSQGFTRGMIGDGSDHVTVRVDDGTVRFRSLE